MLKHVLQSHFERGASLAKDRLGLGQALPKGYAILQSSSGHLYWVNERGEQCEPIETNDARVIRHSANVHKLKAQQNGMERPKQQVLHHQR